MRVIALEEHMATPDVIEAWRQLDSRRRDVSFKMSTEGRIRRDLVDLSDERIVAMDAAGVDVQVLSLTTPGVQSISASDALRLQTQVNDLLAETVARRPDRFQAFATLATPAPVEAAKELERAVTELGLCGAMLFGRSGERNMDHPDFWPIYEAASGLGAPLYIHPQSPVPAVRSAYYDGFAADVSAIFAIGGIGWHYESGIQFLRLILSGVLDRFPKLQIILGHWGEVILFYLERVNLLQSAAKLPRSFSEYARDQLYVGPSGIYSQRYLRWALDVLGADRLLFSTDYPFEKRVDGEPLRFLLEAEMSEIDRHKFASGNFERLLSSLRL